MGNNIKNPSSGPIGIKISRRQVNWPLIGNHHIKSYLIESLDQEKVAGTYIFHGPDNLGKTTAAIFFSKILLCENNRNTARELPCGSCPSCRQFRQLVHADKDQPEEGESGQETISSHGDFHIVKKAKDKKNISIEQVRDIIKILGMSSFLNSYKVGIIKHSEHLSDGAANALLKTLEEPKEKVVIILVLSDLARLPQTIISRAQLLEFKTVKTDDIYEFLIENKKAPRSQARNIARLSLGRPALAMKFFENKEFYEIYTERMGIFLDFYNQDINQRIKAIDEILLRGLSSFEHARIAQRLLEIWLGIIRDMVLLNFGHRDLIQHEIAEDRIAVLNKTYDINKLFKLLDNLQLARQYLSSNVSPKLVLENIAINI